MKILFIILLIIGSQSFAANEYKQPNAAIFYNTLSLPLLNAAGIVTNTSGGQLGSVSVVPIANGGTNNATLAPVLGGVIYSDATKLNTLTAGTSGQVLKSGGAASPTWGSVVTSLNGLTGSAQTFVNDTNVIITSTGTSHTLGWSGALGVSRGGTNNGSLGPLLGGVVYSDATKLNVLAAGTSGQVLSSAGANAPSWIAAPVESLNGLTGSTQTFVNDTNVVITSAGTSHTLGWSGALSIARGGTNNGTLGPVLGGIAYSDASKLNILAAGTSGQILSSGGAGIPTWLSLLPMSSGGTGANVTGAAGGIMYGATSTTMAVKVAGTSGQVLTSGGAGAPTWTSIVPLANGGTNSSAAAVNGGIVYSTASAHAITAAGTSGQVLLSGGAGIPTWEGPLAIAHGGTNNGSLAPVLGGIIYSDASKLNTLAAGTSGQVLKSNGGAAPTWGTASGGSTFQYFNSSQVTTSSTGITSTTFVTASNSPALSFTPTVTGKYKVYTSIPIQNSTSLQGAYAKIFNTTGAATLVAETQSITYGSASLLVSTYIQSVYTLTSGTAYVFDVQVQVTGGGNSATVRGDIAPFYLYAQEVQ